MKKHILLATGLFYIFCFCLFSSNAQTSYKDVAPILIANCTPCHHNGGISFSLTQYSDVVPNGSIIKNALLNNVMPPWPADPSYKHYVHERVVSVADKTLLSNWIDNGMLAGDTTQAPPTPIYGNAQLNGTPDMVLSMPVITSTSTTTDKYICVNVNVIIPQDRYIRAFEYLPSNPAIIHHAVITIDTTGLAVDDLSGNCVNFQGQINIGDYAPGMGPTVLPGVSPAKFGFRLKAGSKISIQLHIPEGTAGQIDSSKLNLFFYPIGETGIREMYFQTVLQNWNFYIPANDSITATAQYPTGAAGLPIDISLYGSFPHSHKTCVGIVNYAYSNTDTIPLIRIPHWDFHWQGQYTFTSLVKFPAGYHLFASHRFDNTINNPETPDPNAPVLPGLYTNDEMLFDSYLYTFYLPGDELIDIAAILSTDTLLNPTGILQQLPSFSEVTVSPNPFTFKTNINYYLVYPQYIQLKVINYLGQEVKKITSCIEGNGAHTHSWDGTDNYGNRLPSGIYVYKLQAGKSVASGKIVLQ